MFGEVVAWSLSPAIPSQPPLPHRVSREIAWWVSVCLRIPVPGYYLIHSLVHNPQDLGKGLVHLVILSGRLVFRLIYAQ